MSTASVSERGYGLNRRPMEYFCNTFAGAVLVPKKELLNNPRIQGITGTRSFSHEELRELSKEFKVSQEVILRRLTILGKSTTAFYKQKRDEWLTAERKPRKGGGKTDPPKKCIQDKGVPYVARIINSHREGKITYADIADYLGIRLKHVSRLERLLNGKSAT